MHRVSYSYIYVYILIHLYMGVRVCLCLYALKYISVRRGLNIYIYVDTCESMHHIYKENRPLLCL